MKYLWVLFSIITLWIGFYIGSEILGAPEFK